MQERLNYLNELKPETKTSILKTNISKIQIKTIKNDKPKIELRNPIVINSNDHILVNGKSGSGKTSLLYVLKGIIKPNEIVVEPSIQLINSQTYITLPSHKSLYNGHLYDIITNYDEEPNIALINYALKAVKIDYRLSKNEFVNIESLSGGEKIRVLIARIIYAVKTRNYNILLFDEIDENLNEELAIEICTNLKTIFKDKIILYITHNEKVKDLFDKKFFVKDGTIN